MLPVTGLTIAELNEMSPLVLAYVGDAVYELAIRSRLAAGQRRKINEIHLDAVNLTKAEAQAETLRMIEEHLTDEEIAIVKRGRNAKSHSRPKNAGIANHRLSTGLEALFGYLYLKGDSQRLQEILEWAIDLD